MIGMTKAEDVFGSFVSTSDNVGVVWACAVSVATDSAHSMTEKKAGVVAKLKEKVHTANGGLDFWMFHCFIHEEALCCKSQKMCHVMVVVKAVNFIRARGLNHHQFDNLLNDEGVSNGLPYHTEVRWLSCGIELKRLFLAVRGILNFRNIKGQPFVQLQIPELVQDLVFVVDIANHLLNLNGMLQDHNKVVTVL